jgi:hypothetical protein
MNDGINYVSKVLLSYSIENAGKPPGSSTSTTGTHFARLKAEAPVSSHNVTAFCYALSINTEAQKGHLTPADLMHYICEIDTHLPSARKECHQK